MKSVKRHLISILLIICFLYSCTSTHYNKKFFPPQENIPPNRAKTIAVLPFKNLTDNYELSDLVRNSFYSHLAIRAFKDVELNIVDSVLKKIPSHEISVSNKNFIKYISKKLHADYLLFGIIKSNKKIYLGLYSLNSVEIEINIIDATNCNSAWRDNIIFKKHNGGLPTSLIELPFITYDSGTNIENNSTFSLIENACRLLAYRIPSKIIGKKKDKIKFFIQVGAFLNKDRALVLYNKLFVKKYRVYIKHTKNNGQQWYKVILGPFESLQKALLTKKALIKDFKIKPILKTF